MTRLKKAPQRMCVACGTRREQKSLVRIVQDPDSGLTIGGGRSSGRGAYICPNVECWNKALKGNRLEHRLRTTLTAGSRAALLQYMSSLQESDTNGKVFTEQE